MWGLSLAPLSMASCMHYNFARPHKTLIRARNGYPTTSAMAAGVADHVCTFTEMAALLS